MLGDKITSMDSAVSSIMASRFFSPQFAVQSRPITDASNRVKSFLGECTAQVG